MLDLRFITCWRLFNCLAVFSSFLGFPCVCILLRVNTRIYIYIYCHPQTDCFVLSELFSVARHAGRSKPGSKPVQLYVRLSFRPVGHQADHVIYQHSRLPGKRKKTRQNLEITISRITAWGKKTKNYFGKKIKKRPTSSHQLKKIKRYAVCWLKEQKPTVKCCNATITNSAQYKSRANYLGETVVG